MGAYDQVPSPTDTKAGGRRLRVLLVIEQCNPEWSSVPFVGYKFFEHLGLACDVTLVTHERNEAALRKRHPDATIHFLKEARLGAAWHALASRLTTIRGNTIWPLYHSLTYPTYAEFNALVAKQFGPDVEAGAYDVVHAITPMLPRYPYKISRHCRSTPFVIGPVNGGVPYPDAFGDIARSEMSYLNALRRIGKLVLRGYADTYRRADYVFSGSLFTKELIERMFAVKKPVEVLAENGLDLSFFAQRSRPPEQQAADGPLPPLALLFVGRLVPYKGADILLDALAALPADVAASTRLTIVGDGAERRSLDEQVARLGLRDVVRFTGWVKHEETLTYYRSSELFCLPSVREFGGAVVLEALANGLPCIVVDNGGIGEYVTSQVGFKIAPTSREEVVRHLARHIETVARDRQLLLHLSQAATRRAEDYTWPRKAERIVQVYHDLIAEKGRATVSTE